MDRFAVWERWLLLQVLTPLHAVTSVRAVLTKAHWARAQGPWIFFLFERPPTGCGEIIKKTNYLITFAKINCKGNPVNTF